MIIKLTEKQLYLLNKYNIEICALEDIFSQKPIETLVIIYRIITDACPEGMKSFIENNNLDNVKNIADFIEITTRTNFYGCSKFKLFFYIE